MTDYKGRVGVIGATSFIGECLLPLLVKDGWDVVAFSRQAQPAEKSAEHLPITWRKLPESKSFVHEKIFQSDEPIHFWISLSPIMTLPEYFPLLPAYGAKHVVAISSTSRFTKEDSSDAAEKELARRFVENEERLIAWATKESLTFTILRPTLVYGFGRDKNVSTIASFIRRFSFFPVLGTARGLRQPVHAEDVALCCVAALTSGAAGNKSYNVSGKDTISYREMVSRIFTALHKKPRLIVFPIWLFVLAVFFLRRLPPFRYWSAAMVQRMNKDMVFDHSAAEHDLNFAPRGFQPGRKDVLNINF